MVEDHLGDKNIICIADMENEIVTLGPEFDAVMEFLTPFELGRAFTKLETREDPIQIDIGEAELKEIALDFKQTHVDKMKNIAESQIMKFDDFLNGREILKLVAKRLVLYWAKFDQLCRSAVKNGPAPPWFANLISTQQLVCNIRPMTESF